MTDYKFIRQIPGGCFGCLALVEKDGIEYIKKTILNPKKDYLIDREIRILSKLETVEGITKIITDYIPGKDLSFWIRDKTKFSILTSLLVILNNIHIHGVAHSDVKPENIMFNREGYQIDSQRLSRGRASDRA